MNVHKPQKAHLDPLRDVCVCNMKEISPWVAEISSGNNKNTLLYSDLFLNDCLDPNFLMDFPEV